MKAFSVLQDCGWFDFESLPPAEAQAKPAAATAAVAAKPKVISFNADTGKPENSQDTVEKKTQQGEWTPLPREEWLGQAITQDTGKKEAYIGAVLLVLRDKHQRETGRGVSLCQHTTSNKVRVVTKDAAAAGHIELWPCVPKQS